MFNLEKIRLDEKFNRERLIRLRNTSIETCLLEYRNKPRVDCKNRVIISLTSTAERFKHIDLVLKSLLDQSFRVDCINICLPELCDLEPFIYDLKDYMFDNEHVEILRCKEDLGPSTKFIPSYLKERHLPNSRIITVDDDCNYNYYLVETLVKWSNKLPDTAIGCFGMKIPYGKLPSEIVLCKDLETKKNICSSDNNGILTYVDVLFGHGGVLYKPRFFSDKMIDYSKAPKACRYEDDLWFSGHLHLAEIDRVVVPSDSSLMFPTRIRELVDTRSLRHTVNKDCSNMDIVYKHLFT